VRVFASFLEHCWSFVQHYYPTSARCAAVLDVPLRSNFTQQLVRAQKKKPGKTKRESEEAFLGKNTSLATRNATFFLVLTCRL